MGGSSSRPQQRSNYNNPLTPPKPQNISGDHLREYIDLTGGDKNSVSRMGTNKGFSKAIGIANNIFIRKNAIKTAISDSADRESALILIRNMTGPPAGADAFDNDDIKKLATLPLTNKYIVGALYNIMNLPKYKTLNTNFNIDMEKCKVDGDSNNLCERLERALLQTPSMQSQLKRASSVGLSGGSRRVKRRKGSNRTARRRG